MKLILRDSTLCFQKTNVIRPTSVVDGLIDINSGIVDGGFSNWKTLIYPITYQSKVSIKTYLGDSASGVCAWSRYKNSERINYPYDGITWTEGFWIGDNIDVKYGDTLKVSYNILCPDLEQLFVRATEYDYSIHEYLQPTNILNGKLLKSNGNTTDNPYHNTNVYDVTNVSRVVVRTTSIENVTDPPIVTMMDSTVIETIASTDAGRRGVYYTVDVINCNILKVCTYYKMGIIVEKLI